MSDKPRRVLVVEDEALIAMNIQTELEDRGWQVVGPAGTAGRALNPLATEAVTVALLDINLRDSDSSSVALALEEAGLPFVNLSGETATMGPSSVGSRPLLSKPIDYGTLVDTLDAVCDGAG